MSDAPERIWADLERTKFSKAPSHLPNNKNKEVCYIRADVAYRWRSLLARIHTASFPGTRAEGDDLEAALEEAGEVLSND